jgi:outer membrane immunogenic protein
MKKLSLGAVALVVSVVSASAADLPAPPVYTKAPMIEAAYNWSGFYVGGDFGYLWGKSRVLDDGVLTESGAPTNGVIGGILAGYNWQRGPLVFGIEGDFGWSNAVGHGLVLIPTPPAPPPVPQPNTYHLNWDSHFVGKVGYASGQWLFFATGGLAVAGFGFQEGVPIGSPLASIQNATFVGFSLGAGMNYAFTQNLIGGLQYIYDDFGNQNFTALDGGTYNVAFKSQTVRGTLSWKFAP